MMPIEHAAHQATRSLFDDLHDIAHGIQHTIHPHGYHETGGTADAADPQPGGHTAMTALADVAASLAAHVATITQADTEAQTIATRLTRYENEPLVADLLRVLDAVPAAREVITPVVASLSALANAVTPAAAPAEPATETDGLQRQAEMGGIAQ